MRLRGIASALASFSVGILLGAALSASLAVASHNPGGGYPWDFYCDYSCEGNSADNDMYGDPNHNLIYAHAGEDWVWGRAEWDHLYGHSDPDFILAGSGGDYVYGNDGFDYWACGNYACGLDGEDGFDRAVDGGDGQDVAYGGAADDIVDGGEGGDIVVTWDDGLPGDFIYGGPGDDHCYLDNGDDPVGCEHKHYS